MKRQFLRKRKCSLTLSSLEFAWDHGGPATRSFISDFITDIKKRAPDIDLSKVVLDSRVHMLMPGWYPCIPGWHHDDVPRERADGQPEYDSPSYRSNHALALFGGDICPTEFAIGTVEFSDPKNHEVVYREWHKEVEHLLETGKLRKEYCPSEQIVYFNDRTWHQGVAAKDKGWRLFIRCSWNTGRKPSNEIRTQVQVYLENPMMGW